ncbi:MAG: sodium:solute symporter family protein, partial [Clostridia bacterium]|nr:sodium:solute symporter family protein [Clostridia bacterium]
VAGIILGTILITAVSGGAGLSFGMATILTRDILKLLPHRWDDPKRELMAVRACIGGILLAAVAVTVSLPDSLINDFGFLSMGFRASVLFLPMTAALWLPGRIDGRVVLLSMILSPCAVLVAKLFALPGDPLLYGMAVSCIICGAGYLMGRKKEPTIGSL